MRRLAHNPPTQRVLDELARSSDPDARFVLADAWDDLGRHDVAMLWRDELPERRRTRKRIEKLTEAERARMRPWADDWIAIGLSTEPADRPWFEAAVCALYRFAGHAAPPIVAWYANPVDAGRAYVEERRDSVRASVWDSVGDSVRASVWDSVWDSVRASVWDSVGDSVRASVWASVWDSVRDSVGASVTVWASVGASVGASASWSFCLDVLRLDMGRDAELRARAMIATAASAFWWWPADGKVYVSERAETIVLEERTGRLVRATWPDGWTVARAP